MARGDKSDVSLSVIKTLFALSANVCAYRGCEVVLTDPKWKRVKAQIAHIYGERPGSARFAATMTDEERNGFANLILMCPNHHTDIDDTRPDDHAPELLQQMKADSEARGNATVKLWYGTEAQLEKFARLLLVGMTTASEPEPLESVHRIRLDLLENADAMTHELWLFNDGVSRIFNIKFVVISDPDQAWDLGMWEQRLGSINAQLEPTASVIVGSVDTYELKSPTTFRVVYDVGDVQASEEWVLTPEVQTTPDGPEKTWRLTNLIRR